MSFQEILHTVVSGKDLTEYEMMTAMTQVMEGKVIDSQFAAFLTALQLKHETVPEIVGAARVMRSKAEKVKVNASHIVDTCGTGGDGADTFNISTAVSFVVAGADITVAKHGNRAVSSKSGSADVLKCLGVNIDAPLSTVERCIEEVGIGFLFAPLMHKAMKHAAKVRKELGFRTIFNLLGPLTNPAHAHGQVLGVYDSKWVIPLAEVLRDLGSRRALVVHGFDGLDEITLTSETQVSELNNDNVSNFTIDPKEFGYTLCSAKDLKGGSPEENAETIRGILQGASGPKTDIIVLNAAAAIYVGGKAETIEQGILVAANSISSGAANKKLDELCRVSNS
tara:strand:- start:10 stop:1023 length:1014 start_codon:yes stop_codon:yes gene_type:complete